MSQEKQIIVSFPGEIKKVETLVDRGLSIKLHTQEMQEEDIAMMFKIKGLLGYFLFKSAPITQDDVATIPEEVREFKNDRTPSQRLRAVIYRLWEQTGKNGEGFLEFYSRHVDKLVDQYKEMLQ